MFGIFNKMLGKDPLSKSLQEFKSLTSLEAKRQKALKEYGAEAEVELALQKDILDNNICTLARVFTSTKPKILDTKKNEYFNIQGSDVQVFTLHQPKDVYTHKSTGAVTPVEELKILLELVSKQYKLERKFQSLKRGKIKEKAFSRINHFALKKINKKIVQYCNLFKGNEELTRKFVFRNMVEPDEDYHNDLMVYDRLNFLGSLVEATNGAVQDSTKIDIDSKMLIQISNQDFHSTMNFELFLEELKNLKYDFIVKVRTVGEMSS